MLLKIIGSAGFILLMLGAASMDSPSVVVPVCMMAAGIVILTVAQKYEERIAEK